ncbi:MAG: CDP-glycerol glycerophosphotransferase family protein [Acetobacter sp.]|nr:CDP-glycerol glycerophosphotransferase family protein [Bacteroides sp.]MCM1341242.1 CDP-glycerol glycerophosphotransferase family protein [Acetobacter sp.]MCM1433885.1 CDP-glycerol glycerophosphotransferase family protein [Clostridiales bacterium]
MENNFSENDKPLVSVICITYGHEDYIAQALDSFVSQKTNFKYQILVGEDKGPDRTAEIVLEYAEKYPDLIIPFIREQNMGAQRNLIDLCRRAGTPYVAFCEGDDYWIDEYKLQKQFDFMQENPDYRACFHNTRIQADESWYLNDWYIPDENGDIFIPSSIPGYDNSLTTIYMDYYIKYGPAHTSSIFYRWDNSRDIPEWYYRHIYGDHSLMMIQAGDEPIGFIPDTMSVYRRSEVGVIMFDSKTDHFLKSRASWIEMAMDLENYFKKYYNSFANKDIRNRIAVEFNNYIRYIIKTGDFELLKEAYEKYPYAASLAAESNDAVRRRMNTLNGIYTVEGVNLLLKDKKVQKSINKKLEKREEKLTDSAVKKVCFYSSFADAPKDKSLWVFSCEGRKSFSGNTKNLYEYVIAYHPEIHPVWITKNQSLLKLAEAENLPMVKIGSEECTEIMKKASVAFVNDSKTKALNVKGFNAGTKIVRLGKGSYIRDFTKDDIYKEDEFSPNGNPQKVVDSKPERYSSVTLDNINKNYFVENYEDTFLSIAPNKKIAKIQEEFFNIPKENIMICGAPRSYAVRDNKGDTRRKILLSPAPRKSIINQEAYLNNFFKHAEQINERLKNLDVFMDFFLDKRYSPVEKTRLNGILDRYSHINTLNAGDLFCNLPNYELMINDYGNSMFDFILMNKPVVIFNNDKDIYLDATPMLYDYDKIMPGQQTADWMEAMDMVEARLADPTIDKELRQRTKDTMYDMSANDKNNSERIIEKVKQMLG